MDDIRQVKSDEEIIQTLKEMGRKVIPRLVRGRNFVKRHGHPLEITEPLFNGFRLRTCPDCGEDKEFFIFKYVCICRNCQQFYYIVRA